MALFDNYNTGDDGTVNVQTVVWVSQSFIVTTSFKISSVKVYLQKRTTGGTITVTLQEVSGGEPDGVTIRSGTNDDNTAGLLWREITFDSAVTLGIGVEYVIIVSVGAAEEGFAWRRDTASTYSGTAWSTLDGGVIWSEIANSDFMFECWGDAITHEPPSERVTIKKLVAFADDQVYYET